MSFKIDDKVKVKEHLEVDCDYGSDMFTSDMAKYRGKEATITDFREGWGDSLVYVLDIDDGNWNWTEEMLEGLEGKAVKPKVLCDKDSLSRTCGHCGKILGIFDNYCSRCGTKIDKTPDIYEYALDWLIEKIYENGVELKNLPEIETYYDVVENLSKKEKLKWAALQEGIKLKNETIKS